MLEGLRVIRRGMLAAIVLILLYVMVLWPVLHGYHVGYNVATDRVCISRVIQWCK